MGTNGTATSRYELTKTEVVFVAVFDELSVDVTSDTADFSAGMNRVEEGLDNVQREALLAASATDIMGESIDDVATDALTTAGAMQVLANRTDNAGDQMTETAVKAGTTSGAFGALTLSTDGASASIGGLSATLVLSLLPALTVVTGAVVPLVSALGGLVAIGAAIGGVGLAAALGAIATDTELLKQEAMALLDTIKGEFEPLFSAATGVLVTFIDELQALVPTLVPAEDTINTLANQFETLGLSVISSLPAFVELATTIATEFLPAATELVEGVLNAAPGFIQTLVSDFQRLAPTLSDAVDATATLLGTLREFGFNVLPVVTNAVGRIVGFVDSVLTRFNQLSGGTQRLLTVFSLLAPVITALVGIVGGISAPVVAAIGAVVGLAAAWKNNFGGIRDIVRQAVNEIRPILKNQLPTLISNLKTIFREIKPVVEPIFSLLTRFLTTTLVNTVDFAISVLTALSQFLVGDFSGAWATIADFIQRAFGNTVEFVINAANDVVVALVETVNKLGEIAEEAAAVAGIDFDAPNLNPSEFKIDNPQQQATDFTNQVGQTAQNIGQEASQTIEVIVEGDTDVVKDTAAQVVQEEADAATRATGGTQRP